MPRLPGPRPGETSAQDAKAGNTRHAKRAPNRAMALGRPCPKLSKGCGYCRGLRLKSASGAYIA